MNQSGKKHKAAGNLLKIIIRRSWCALIVLWFLFPASFADDTGLINPAEREFGEFRLDTKNTGSFARKTPAFDDRTLPAPKQRTPQESEPIRQVSTTADDPFPPGVQPIIPPTNANSFEWTDSTPTSTYHQPQQSLLQYNNSTLYDPNALAVMQNVQPFMQYPQPYPQQQGIMTQHGFMMDGLNPLSDPYGSILFAQSNQPHYGQFVQMDPYHWSFQNMQEQQQLYQTLMLQELARQQADVQNTANGKSGSKTETDEKKEESGANWTLNNLAPLRVSSPLGETMLVCAKTISPFNTPTGPDKGVGMPLVGKSWLDHPYYFGGFIGSMSGSQLVSRMINQSSGGTGGLMFGYNFNDYWGLESRLHFSAIDIRDTEYARQLFEAAWEQDNPGMLPPPQTSRTNELTILDVSVHYYPLGNAKWRPYFKYGLGVGQQKFVNTFGYRETSDVFTMPMGLGLRYWWNERIAFQMDLNNNMIFASGIAKTQNNFAFTMGLTYSFGTGRRTPPVYYWPATPSMGSKW